MADLTVGVTFQFDLALKYVGPAYGMWRVHSLEAV